MFGFFLVFKYVSEAGEKRKAGLSFLNLLYLIYGGRCGFINRPQKSSKILFVLTKVSCDLHFGVKQRFVPIYVGPVLL